MEVAGTRARPGHLFTRHTACRLPRLPLSLAFPLFLILLLIIPARETPARRELLVQGHRPVLSWDSSPKCWWQMGRHVPTGVCTPSPPRAPGPVPRQVGLVPLTSRDMDKMKCRGLGQGDAPARALASSGPPVRTRSARRKNLARGPLPTLAALTPEGLGVDPGRSSPGLSGPVSVSRVDCGEAWISDPFCSSWSGEPWRLCLHMDSNCLSGTLAWGCHASQAAGTEGPAGSGAGGPPVTGSLARGLTAQPTSH